MESLIIILKAYQIPTELIDKIIIMTATVNMALIIDSYGIDYYDLCAYLKKYQGVITGSFLLHCLHGCPFNNINILVHSPEYDERVTTDFCGIDNIIWVAEDHDEKEHYFDFERTFLTGKNDGSWNDIYPEIECLSDEDGLRDKPTKLTLSFETDNEDEQNNLTVPDEQDENNTSLNDLSSVNKFAVLKNPNYTYQYVCGPYGASSGAIYTKNCTIAQHIKLSRNEGATSVPLYIKLVVVASNPKILLKQYVGLDCAKIMFDGYNSWFFPFDSVNKFIITRNIKLTVPVQNYFDPFYSNLTHIQIWNASSNVPFNIDNIHPNMLGYFYQYHKYFDHGSIWEPIDFFRLIGEDYDLENYHYYFDYIDNNLQSIILTYQDLVSECYVDWTDVDQLLVATVYPLSRMQRTIYGKFLRKFTKSIYHNYKMWYYIMKWICYGYNIVNLDKFSME